MTLVPPSLTEEFTAKEFQKACHLSPKMSSYALQVLRHINAIEQVGMKGRAYLYNRK